MEIRLAHRCGLHSVVSGSYVLGMMGIIASRACLFVDDHGVKGCVILIKCPLKGSVCTLLYKKNEKRRPSRCIQ